MEFKVYNTQTKQKEVFKADGEVTLYTCGPTVYNFAHVGNLRAYMFEDILKRVLLYFGYDVKHVMNLTDVEDKIIKSCREKGVKLNDYTKQYIDAFKEDLKNLNILPADVYPKATEHINEIVALIKNLLDKGIAYKSEDGSIYFSVDKFPKYGTLHNINKEEMKKGVRIDQDEYTKDYFGDFSLWKAYDENDGDVFWETEIGKGRPGWHIECSAMSMKHLTKAFEGGLHPENFSTIDIHCGGVDNIFPHHENEIAQTEAVTGKKYVNYWIHCEYLLSEGKKMSKSLGNFYTLRDLIEKGITYREIRFVLATGHYRNKLNFSQDGVVAAKSSLKRIDNFINNLIIKVDDSCESNFKADTYLKSFEEDMADDMNMSKAMSRVFLLIKDVNKEKSISVAVWHEIMRVFEAMDKIFGFLFSNEEVKSNISEEEILRCVEERSKAREIKDFSKSDEIRDYLQNQGVVIKDVINGTMWLYKDKSGSLVLKKNF